MVNKTLNGVQNGAPSGSSGAEFLQLFGDSRHPFAAGFDPERRAGKVVFDRLIAAAEMFGEKCLGHAVKRKAVFRPRETMPIKNLSWTP